MKRFISIAFLSALFPFITACDGDTHVLAEVNGKEITQEQFDAYLQLKHVPAEDKERREKVLKEYLQREGLAEIIAKEGKLDAAAIEAEVNEFRKEMLISRYFDDFLSDAVGEESVQNAYGSDAAKYETKKVHAAHILFRTNKRMSEEQRKAKLTSAQEVHSKIQSGESFEELAKQFSEDKISGSRAGDLGWIKEGTIDDRFSKRAFELKAGTVSEPFETAFGFHILKVIEEAKTIRRPLGAVAGEIRYKLRDQAKEKELKRLEEAVKVKTVKAYDEKLTPKEEKDSKPKASSQPEMPELNGKSGTASDKPTSNPFPTPPAQVPTVPAPGDEDATPAPTKPAAPAPKPAAPAPTKPAAPAPVPAPPTAPAMPAPAPAPAP